MDPNLLSDLDFEGSAPEHNSIRRRGLTSSRAVLPPSSAFRSVSVDDDARVGECVGTCGVLGGPQRYRDRLQDVAQNMGGN